MNQPPFVDQFVSRFWQTALINPAGFNFNQRLVFGVNGVKMRRRMVAE